MLEELLIALGFEYDSKGLTAFKKGLNSAKNVAKKFASAVKTVGIGVAAGLAVISTAAIKVGMSIFDTGREFEKMRLSLDALEGSTAKGKKAMDWIVDFAKSTPLELAQVTKSYINMRNMGLDPTDGSFQALVDTMSATGRGADALDGIVLALGQAWTKTKLQGDDARQLLERGVPVYDILSKAMGKSTEQIMEMQSQGKLGRKEIQLLITTLGERYAGASDKFAKSSEGIISNLSDLFTIAKKKVADSGFFDAVKDKLGELLGAFDGLFESGKIDVMAQKLSDVLVVALDAVSQIISNITVDDLVDAFDTLVSISKTFFAILGGIGDVISMIISSVQWVGDLFGLILSKGDALKIILGGMVLLFAPWVAAVAAIVLAIADINNYLSGTDSYVGTIIASFNNLWASVSQGAADFYNKWVKKIVNALKSVGNFFGIGGDDEDTGTPRTNNGPGRSLGRGGSNAPADVERATKPVKNAPADVERATKPVKDVSAMIAKIKEMSLPSHVEKAAIEQVTANSNNQTTNTANVNVNMTVNEAGAPGVVGYAVAKAATDAAFQSAGTTAKEPGS